MDVGPKRDLVGEFANVWKISIHYGAEKNWNNLVWDCTATFVSYPVVQLLIDANSASDCLVCVLDKYS